MSYQDIGFEANEQGKGGATLAFGIGLALALGIIIAALVFG